MITEQSKNIVYFSKYLKSDYPKVFQKIASYLDSHGVEYGLLQGTKDYWCRDFMPVQTGQGTFVQFIYNPDYLKNKERYRTDADKVVKPFEPCSIVKCPLVIDGGNVVICEEKTNNGTHRKPIWVMTDKVMLENTSVSQEQIEAIIREAVGCKELEFVWLPWRHSDMCGHTDGIIRYIGNDATGKARVLVNLNLYETEHAAEMRAILSKKFEVIDLTLSHYDELSWAYINFLQTDKVILLPSIQDEQSDLEAYQQIYHLLPGKIGVCCYSGLAERSAEYYVNSIFTDLDYQEITNISQADFL